MAMNQVAGHDLDPIVEDFLNRNFPFPLGTFLAIVASVTILLFDKLCRCSLSPIGTHSEMHIDSPVRLSRERLRIFCAGN